MSAPAVRAAVTPDAPILRRTRWRLMAWSAGSTLAILLVLGGAIYGAAASSLAAAGTAQLRARLNEMVGGTGPVFTRSVQAGVTTNPGEPGLVIGGASSGTIAFVVGALPGTSVPAGAGFSEVEPGISVDKTGGGGPMPDPLLPITVDPLVMAQARAGGPIVVETTVADAPVRAMVAVMPIPNGSATIVVLGDRTAELDTLRTLLLVLLGGGVAVLAASMAVGYVYAGRALVPIRESLRRQREFAADASHELRTPLAISRAAIAELRRGRQDPVVVERALDDLDAGATRLESLVDDLLLLARADADAVELVLGDADLAQAAAEAAETLEPVAAARGVRLALDVEPAPVRGDQARLAQLAAILLDNAIRHSPEGGRVTVTVRPGARLVVDDEGPGIAPEHREAVFERFWRAPGAPSGGTGLGLAIARWIVARHDGSIRAGSRDAGAGASFTVRIPGA